MHANRGLKIGALLCSVAVGCLPLFAQTPDASAAPETAKPKADIIFIHGNVYTGVPDDTPFSSVLRAEAIAVRGGRIQALGKTLDIVKLKGPDTKVVDLGGHLAMPGFNDAHLHLDDAGSTKLSIDLTGVKSLDDLRSLVQKKVGTAKAGEWILGSG